jgi:hypothetical protein
MVAPLWDGVTVDDTIAAVDGGVHAAKVGGNNRAYRRATEGTPEIDVGSSLTATDLR